MEKEDPSAAKALERNLAFHDSGVMLSILYWKGLCPASESRKPPSWAFLNHVTGAMV